jgi:hypothetical protein
MTTACLISLKHEPCVEKAVGLSQPLASRFHFMQQMTQCDKVTDKTLANIHSQGL